MGAGPVPEVLHRALIGFAWLVRARLVRSLLPLAPLMHWATNHLRWGEHRGGMFVEVEGTRAGVPVRHRWHMIAEGDLVATYKTFTGTHTGDFFGTPATGKRATIRVMDFVRYDDGRIAEHWNIVDLPGLMAQLQA